MKLSERFDDAVAYANRVHGNQRRKGSEVPYLSHLLAVASLVLEYGGDEDEAIAALLHDAPEDRGGSPVLERIRERFGDRVAGIVEGCSDSLVEDPRQKEPWQFRKERYHEHLRETGDSSVLLVSAADKLHNARATLSDVQRLGPSVWNRFSSTPEQALWNYRELLEAYRASADPRVQHAVAELQPVVDALDALT
ncbi:MAG: HD domain-containing protein [Candidatus Cybelea sp.]|jgi:(p)ppGpp synthase/HD superfamily hydrolase